VIGLRPTEERENLSCIPNGVDTKSFRPTGAQKEFDLLFVGNFYWVKGVDVLLAAVGRLHSQGIDAKLAVAGKFDANQRKYLTNALPPAVRANLSFLGVVERARMPELMNSARLVVVPSRYETFGMVALEAIACGVPVVATRVGGLPEVVDSSVGRLVGTPDPESLAEAIQLCLRDDELAKRCSALGPRRALGYDWSVVASQLMKVFGTR
jgi:D-inositol-3-phosphate glycosyltransferase